jgi:hypothetical protein
MLMRPLPSPYLLLPLLLLLWLLQPHASHAQVSATLRFAQETYLAGEPVIATLTVNNQAGRDITLKPGVTEETWCLIQLNAMRGEAPTHRTNTPVVPPLFIPAGESVSRTIPVNEFFELPGSGQYRAKVSISYGATRAQFVTPTAFFNVDPGHKIWSTSVGIPDGQQNEGKPRIFSVLSLQRREGMFLYAKLENPEDGSYYPPYFLGRMLSAVAPQMQTDRENNLYVLHAASDDTYILSQIDVATGRSGQAVYRSKTPRAGRPSLLRQPDGKLAIAGGVRMSNEELTGSPNPERAKISSRPEGFKQPKN